jgi:hypothetical protein
LDAPVTTATFPFSLLIGFVLEDLSRLLLFHSSKLWNYSSINTNY